MSSTPPQNRPTTPTMTTPSVQVPPLNLTWAERRPLQELPTERRVNKRSSSPLLPDMGGSPKRGRYVEDFDIARFESFSQYDIDELSEPIME